MNRAELLNSIKSGNFKLRKVEILDKSAPVLVENQDVAKISTSGYESVPVAPCAPPPPQMMASPPPLGVPRIPKPITNSAVLKLATRSAKDAKPDIEALFNQIKSGGIRLRKTVTNDKSGLILDEDQKAKMMAQAEPLNEEKQQPVDEAPSVKPTKKKKKAVKKPA